MDVKPRENYGCRETDFVASEQHRFSELWYVGECKDYDRKVGVEEVAQLHTRPVWSVAFAPDGRTLASGSSDNTVKLWDVATGELLLTLIAMPEGGHLAIAPDGRFDGDTKGLAQVRIGYGLAIYPLEAFPELRFPGLTPRRNS